VPAKQEALIAGIAQEAPDLRNRFLGGFEGRFPLIAGGGGLLRRGGWVLGHARDLQRVCSAFLARRDRAESRPAQFTQAVLIAQRYLRVTTPKLPATASG
jgi:hypothetical protein